MSIIETHYGLPCQVENPGFISKLELVDEYGNRQEIEFNKYYPASKLVGHRINYTIKAPNENNLNNGGVLRFICGQLPKE